MKTSIMMRCPKCAENSQLDNIHLLDHTFKREWVGLTDEEIQPRLNGLPTQSIAVYARNIEAILKEKNNAA